jgi:hypothetical protein
VTNASVVAPVVSDFRAFFSRRVHGYDLGNCQWN